MSEFAEPPDFDSVFNAMVGPIEMGVPTDEDLMIDAGNTAKNMSEALVTRLLELDATPYKSTFHDVPQSDGSIRVAIAPPDQKYRDSDKPVWRIVINEGGFIYLGGRPKEYWDSTDILIRPSDLRLGVVRGQLMYTVGYGETAPQRGMPPRILRNVENYRYSLSYSPGYENKLPDVPHLTREGYLKYYQRYSTTVGSMLDLFKKLSDITLVKGVGDLE